MKIRAIDKWLYFFSGCFFFLFGIASATFPFIKPITENQLLLLISTGIGGLLIIHAILLCKHSSLIICGLSGLAYIGYAWFIFNYEHNIIINEKQLLILLLAIGVGFKMVWSFLSLKPNRCWSILLISSLISLVFIFILWFYIENPATWLIGLILSIDLQAFGFSLVLFGLYTKVTQNSK